MTSSLLEGLNPQQLEAVTLPDVSALILAGAGSGTPGGYSSASSPYPRGSSTHSSPYNISRTGSGASEGSTGLPPSAPHPAELLQALNQQHGLKRCCKQ